MRWYYWLTICDQFIFSKGSKEENATSNWPTFLVLSPINLIKVFCKLEFQYLSSLFKEK